MCLDLNYYQIFPKTASKDIICYKYLVNADAVRMKNFYIRKSKESDLYLTPYKLAPIEIGNTYTSKLKIETEGAKFVINIGLHSFASFESLKYSIRISCYNTSEIIQVQCIIPKGSRYYVGKFAGEISYASNKLIYLKIIK